MNFYTCRYGFAILTLTTITLFACETPEDNTVEKARSCTDNAAKMSFTDDVGAASLATQCDAMISASGINSREANKILFGAILIEEKKMSKIKDLVAAAKSNAGGKDGINAVLTTLAFTSDTAANSYYNSTRLKLAALNSGSPGLQTIASLVSMASVLNSVTSLGSNISDPSSALTAITNCKDLSGGCTQAMQDAIASSAVTLVTSACASASDASSTDPNNLCNKAKGIACNTSSSQAVLNCLNTYANATH